MQVIDHSAVSTLSTQECYSLIRTQSVGRLGVVVNHWPVVVPVSFSLDGEVIVIRSKSGGKLTHANHANVTFEVDSIDEATRTGWSVLFRGQAEELTPAHDQDLIRRTKATGVTPWVPGPDFSWVRIIPHGISGRRITRLRDTDWDLGTAAYM
ncbi:pyridoxamine 5'-phosphate oxidase family protein [Nakamurella antarctica]|uniref:Pyridoxamine 5'-phosphate oxidase family protein n=1 Tax=Nakamurella antarctica TaxID=1902245 RepID=A0A3G8ZTT7_9ACTN|nr:pyridoxamine 5'-phosphate oxidase family protein [Nakamurella antarctica]AZI57211.1 pyridoxamine 5'-phosphate oxidase family protein [Nakamurella antarctica]